MKENKTNELVDLLFSFDMEELEKETDFLQKYKDLKERTNKAIKYLEKTIEENKNLPDYSKHYVEGYDIAIETTHSSHSGVMLETIKSATIKTCEETLKILKGSDNNE